MHAMVMTTTGGPEVLQPKKVENPQIVNPRQLLIKIMAAGINPVDTKLRRNGTYYPEQMPAILGCDGAGVVVAVGSEASRFKPGDEVYYCYGGIGAAPGNYAQFNVIDELYVARKPTSLSFAAAAAAPLVLITAWESLFDRCCSPLAGKTVLIHAGAGGVGHVAIQLAKSAGARVLTTVGTVEKARFVSELGADCAISYQTEDFVAACLDQTDGIGVEVALDTVGGDTFARTFECMAHYGELITLLQPTTTVDWQAARLRNLRITQELMLSPHIFSLDQPLQHQADILQQCAARFEQGELKIELHATPPLHQVAQAHQLIESGHSQGKQALIIESG